MEIHREVSLEERSTRLEAEEFYAEDSRAEVDDSTEGWKSGLPTLLEPMMASLHRLEEIIEHKYSFEGDTSSQGLEEQLSSEILQGSNMPRKDETSQGNILQPIKCFDDLLNSEDMQDDDDACTVVNDLVSEVVNDDNSPRTIFDEYVECSESPYGYRVVKDVLTESNELVVDWSAVVKPPEVLESSIYAIGSLAMIDDNGEYVAPVLCYNPGIPAIFYRILEQVEMVRVVKSAHIPSSLLGLGLRKVGQKSNVWKCLDINDEFKEFSSLDINRVQHYVFAKNHFKKLMQNAFRMIEECVWSIRLYTPIFRTIIMVGHHGIGYSGACLRVSEQMNEISFMRKIHSRLKQRNCVAAFIMMQLQQSVSRILSHDDEELLVLILWTKIQGMHKLCDRDEDKWLAPKNMGLRDACWDSCIVNLGAQIVERKLQEISERVLKTEANLIINSCYGNLFGDQFERDSEWDMKDADGTKIEIQFRKYYFANNKPQPTSNFNMPVFEQACKFCFCHATQVSGISLRTVERGRKLLPLIKGISWGTCLHSQRIESKLQGSSEALMEYSFAFLDDFLELESATVNCFFELEFWLNMRQFSSLRHHGWFDYSCVEDAYALTERMETEGAEAAQGTLLTAIGGQGEIEREKYDHTIEACSLEKNMESFWRHVLGLRCLRVQKQVHVYWEQYSLAGYEDAFILLKLETITVLLRYYLLQLLYSWDKMVTTFKGGTQSSNSCFQDSRTSLALRGEHYYARERLFDDEVQLQWGTLFVLILWCFRGGTGSSASLSEIEKTGYLSFFEIEKSTRRLHIGSNNEERVPTVQEMSRGIEDWLGRTLNSAAILSRYFFTVACFGCITFAIWVPRKSEQGFQYMIAWEWFWEFKLQKVMFITVLLFKLLESCKWGINSWTLHSAAVF